MEPCSLGSWWILLANIGETKVNSAAGDLVSQCQRESDQALRQYWTEGGAINFCATVGQLGALIARTATQLELLGVAKKYGLVNDSYLEGISHALLARMTDEEAQLDPADITITCHECLDDQGVKGKVLRSATHSAGHGRGCPLLSPMRQGSSKDQMPRLRGAPPRAGLRSAGNRPVRHGVG
ncbi:hypothetical protein [Nocardiopsis metallicus]|uniref:Uncharacterized protein n=1 Tax=Nocardiopsis metallicus TaxID=179819 RepID=A0A840WPC8_9ACTN|nr:hypothetical protein [Nocardiopsis metallicus]MBB5493665.1 hypothetical protein [Nocardiopsis metallicus]